MSPAPSAFQQDIPVNTADLPNKANLGTNGHSHGAGDQRPTAGGREATPQKLRPAPAGIQKARPAKPGNGPPLKRVGAGASASAEAGQHGPASLAAESDVANGGAAAELQQHAQRQAPRDAPGSAETAANGAPSLRQAKRGGAAAWQQPSVRVASSPELGEQPGQAKRAKPDSLRPASAASVEQGGASPPASATAASAEVGSSAEVPASAEGAPAASGVGARTASPPAQDQSEPQSSASSGAGSPPLSRQSSPASPVGLADQILHKRSRNVDRAESPADRAASSATSAQPETKRPRAAEPSEPQSALREPDTGKEPLGLAVSGGQTGASRGAAAEATTAATPPLEGRRLNGGKRLKGSRARELLSPEEVVAALSLGESRDPGDDAAPDSQEPQSPSRPQLPAEELPSEAAAAAAVAVPRRDESGEGDTSQEGAATSVVSPGREVSCSQESGSAQLALAATQQIQVARLLLSRGRLAEAEHKVQKLCSAGLPDSPELLCLKGQLQLSSKNALGAFTSFAAALALDEHHVEGLVACGDLHMQWEQPGKAAAFFQRAAAQVSPHAAEANQKLAAALVSQGADHMVQGSVQEAQLSYERALQACPEHAPALYNLGVLHHQQGQEDKALDAYAAAVSLSPHYMEAWCNQAVIHRQRGDLKEALAAYERAAMGAPNHPCVLKGLAGCCAQKASLLNSQGRRAEALKLFDAALMRDSTNADILYHLGVALAEGRQRDRAIFTYRLAVHFRPTFAEAWNNLGVLLRDAGQMEAALEAYKGALQSRPNFPPALSNMAVMLLAQGRAREALHMLQAAILAAPDYAEAHNNLGVLFRDVGEVLAGLAAYERCLECQPSNRNAASNRLLTINYAYPGEAASVCKAHAEWGQNFQKSQELPEPDHFCPTFVATISCLHAQGFEPLEPRPRPTDPATLKAEGARPLVVGYISPDLFVHSVSYFAEGPLTWHSPQVVSPIVYSCVMRPDAKTAKLKAAALAAGGQWRDVAGLSEHELATMVQQDKVDILVELTGHTAHNQLGCMALRPAPVQVTWIGYPNSTGLEAVDYRLTDALCDPKDTVQTFTEELLRLPGCFLCYTPADDAPPVASLPAATNGYITFGSFNALAKITPQVINVWANILKAVPHSRLILKNKPFACDALKAHWLLQLRQHGISSDRIDLLPLNPSNSDHLGTYSLMDISLDPWPYAGTTTTCESLYMGVPVLSLKGACHAHNVGVSLLTALDMQHDWVAGSEDEYVRLAVDAAVDIAGLAALRGQLRQRMLQSRLCQAEPFVRRLESVYREMWLQWLQPAAHPDTL